MDKSLDDIIKSKPRGGAGGKRGRRGGGARQQILGSTPAAAAPANKARKAAAAPTSTVTPQHVADKIIVSNLPIDVNEAQIKELFTTTVGPLREVILNYDAHGKSKGIATVHFQRRGDGTKAYNQYNNRLIDGKRPMKIEVVVDPSRAAPAASLASRVAPAPTASKGAAPMEGVQRTGGRPKRGRGGAAGGRTKRPPKTVADLDAEMEDYTASSAPAAAAAPVAA